MAKFCAVDSCKKIAVGTGIRPIENCRPHYVEMYSGEFEQWRVCIPWREMRIDQDALAIACARTGEDIYEGGTVWLDPVETNILALVEAGYIEALPEPAPKAKADKAGS